MQNLQPKEVFSIFHAITRIPRPSKHEEQIGKWLIAFAQEHNLEYTADEAGNIIMRKPATAGYESHSGVILQAHMDMVCEKNNDIQHDFMTDPIETYVEGDWLRAKGTTLGADNGIGMALALAALTSDTLEHPALEALFTVDEETGLTGAFRLQDGLLQGKRLINLDSEDDGQIFIGCAGGIDTLAKMYYKEMPVETPFCASHLMERSSTPNFAAHVKVGGLLGGHSGDDINKNRANAVKLLTRFLYRVDKDLKDFKDFKDFTDLNELHIASIDAGNLRNAIAREGEATIIVPFAYKEQLRIVFNEFVAEIENEIQDVEKGFTMSLESTDLPLTYFSHSEDLIRTLYACPHGVIAMSRDMPGLVETSTNLASVKMKEDQWGKYTEINTSQRSSIESQKHMIKEMVECALMGTNAIVTHGDGYPGWKPNVNSELLTVARQAYVHLTGDEPAIKAIHAGLECGLFLEKYPYLDMISVGPQMTGVHSPAEQLSISSTAKTWEWLQRILTAL